MLLKLQIPIIFFIYQDNDNEDTIYYYSIEFFLVLFVLSRYYMIDRLHIKNEFKELEDRIEYLVRKAKIVNETEELKQFHIFGLYNILFRVPNYKAYKEEYLDGSFVCYLMPNYYNIKPQGLFKKRKSYLYTRTYITDSKGELVATGDVRFISNSRAYKSSLPENELAKFLFDKKFDMLFYMGGVYGYFTAIKKSKLCVISTFGGEIEVYEWEYFVNNCLDKIVPSQFVEKK